MNPLLLNVQQTYCILCDCDCDRFCISLEYKINVTTADEYLAGTDTQVFIDIIGLDDQSTGAIELDNKGVDDFKRGA